MVWAALVLTLFSAPMHAGWNLLAKRQRSEGLFFLEILKLGALLGLGPAVLSEIFSGFMPARAWVCVLLSGGCAGAYFFFLAKGYADSDFTVVYPIARSLPVLLVGMGDVFRGKNPSLVGWVGMALVAAGCLLTPITRFGEISWRKYIHWSSLWMILAALGTVGYSLSDKIASEVILQGPGSAARYCYFFFAIAFLFYSLLHWRFHPDAKEPHKIRRRVSILGAALTYGSYFLILWAYQLADRASYIVAFRQLSIVLGVIAAFAIYKERGLAVRISAAVIITAGLLLITIWG